MVNLSLKSAVFGFFLGLPVSAIEIDLRYDYDTSGFFNQPGAKAAMRQCADFFENILTDSLERIDARATGRVQNTWTARPKNPTTGATLQLVDLIVPEDTVIIYLGARDLGGFTTGEASSGSSYGGFPSFFETVAGRGQAGALDDPATDYGPWGGSIAFDTRNNNGTTREWNFSTTETSGSKTDFVGVALHELCHILGIGFADSWMELAPEEGGAFVGPASTAANGGTSPWVDPFRGHWAGSSPGPYISPAYGSFGTPHGLPQKALMSSFSSIGLPDIAVVTDLEIAGLIDLGWEVVIPAQGMTLGFLANGGVELTIPTTSNFTYQLQRGTLVAPFANLGPAIAGDGSLKTYVDPNPPEMRGFYRFAISNGSAMRARSSQQVSNPFEIRTGSYFWVTEDCCPH